MTRTAASRSAPESLLVRAEPVHADVMAALHADAFPAIPGETPWSAGTMGRMLAAPGAFGYLLLAREASAATQALKSESPAGDGAAFRVPALPPALPPAPGFDSSPQPVGLFLGRAIAGEGEVLTLAVIHAGRRCGHGRLLLDAGLRHMAACGATEMFLEVAEDNVAALTLYKSGGFTQVGRRDGYYPRIGGKRVAALVLKRVHQSG